MFSLLSLGVPSAILLQLIRGLRLRAQLPKIAISSRVFLCSFHNAHLRNVWVMLEYVVEALGRVV
jgi:hypothetical protein